MTLRLRRDADLTRDKLQEAADAAGESLNAYIVEAIRQRLESDIPTEGTAGEVEKSEV